MSTNRILAADNTTLGVTNLAGGPNPAQAFSGVPLGTPSDSATGALGVKVHVVSSVAPSGGTALTPTITTATTDGSVAAGARAITFIFSTDFAGTILGATFSGSTDSSFNVPIPSGYTMAAVGYTISAGNARIFRA